MHILAEYLHMTYEEWMKLPYEERLRWRLYATLRAMKEEYQIEKSKQEAEKMRKATTVPNTNLGRYRLPR